MRPLVAGIQIVRSPTAEQPIELVASNVTAFIGRTLKGPVNVPVPIASFADYQQTFGGLWQPSPLSYAVEQFFEHGGQQAVIVRVVNGGAPPTISLPCGRETLTLAAIEPGSREFLRAAVDYDNIGDNETDRFNLVVQRLRYPGSERIDAQESFRGISIMPSASRFVATVLLDSRLVRVRGQVPVVRPEATSLYGSGGGVRTHGYISSNPNGNDGGPLTDYDVIGSVESRTGLFALQAIEQVDFIHIPPLSRDTDIGPSSLVVASRYCRERRALLIIDPPAAWTCADDALSGLRELNFSSADACMFFPRLLCMDRLRGSAQVFGNGGAVAGMLARAAQTRSVWNLAAPEPELLLRPGVRPACVLSEVDRWRLAANGINAVQSIRAAGPICLVFRTLAGGSDAATDFGYIAARRLALFLLSSVERGTRWLMQQHADPKAWKQARGQVLTFLQELADQGAFPGTKSGRAFFAIVDDRINTEYDAMLGRVNLLVGFPALKSGEHHAYLITHSTAGSKVRPIAVNLQEGSDVPERDADFLPHIASEKPEVLPSWPG